MTSGVGRGPAGAGRTHGKPGTYAGGCRCEPCRAGIRVWRRERYLANHEAAKAALRASYARNRPARVMAKRTAKYGMTPAAWDGMFLAQAGGCAACGQAFGWRTPNVDHDHATGQIRGLVCSPCNQSLGLLQEDETRIEALLAYLQRSKGGLRLVS